MTFYTVVPSPIEPLMLVSDGSALTGLFMTDHLRGWTPQPDWIEQPDAAPFPLAIQQLSDYFEGRLTQFDLPLAPQGTDFQRRVWQELATIPYGRTLSYIAMAERLGDRLSTRAVGTANGRNPISIIVPCHRVIGADGSLIGFGGGLKRKQALLAFEAAVLAGGPRPFCYSQGELFERA